MWQPRIDFDGRLTANNINNSDKFVLLHTRNHQKFSWITIIKILPSTYNSWLPPWISYKFLPFSTCIAPPPPILQLVVISWLPLFILQLFSLRPHQFLQLGYFCMDLILLYVYIASLELSIIIHIFTFFIQYWWQKSRLTVVSHAASTAEYSCRNNNDVITTSEYFTGMNVAQI